MWVSVKHEYVETLFYLNILQSYITFGSVFSFMFWQSWAYILFRFIHKLYIVRYRERSRFGLKYLVLIWTNISSKISGFAALSGLVLTDTWYQHFSISSLLYCDVSSGTGTSHKLMGCTNIDCIVTLLLLRDEQQTDTQAAGIKRALSTDQHKGLWYL